MNKFILFFLIIIFTFGCSSNEKIITVKEYTYPEIPLIEYPPDIIYDPFKWDWPRKCSDKIKEECNTLDSDSNLFIGLTEENFKLLQLLTNELKAREKYWRSRIDEVNNLFQQWKQKNIERKDLK